MSNAAAGAELTLTGGCLCGAVRYQIVGIPHDPQFCHCRLCQRQFGAAFALWASFPNDGIFWTKGRPKVYRATPIAERGFCGACGSPLFFRYFVTPGSVGIALGTLDRPEEVPPRIHWGIESRLPWLAFADGLPEKRTDEDPETKAAVSAHKGD
ncbi:MAG: GFA family protein [Kiloniellales bacterium]